MAELTPLVMTPVLAEKPWGGRRLADFGKHLPDGALIGESWEVADLPAEAVTTVADPRSRVASGPLAGNSLREVIAAHGAGFLGSAAPTADGDFPLLIKLIDARQHLSVQVHPDGAYVAQHGEARLKTESWYVLQTDPGAHLYLGLRPGATVDDLSRRVGTSGVVGMLDVVATVAGDFHHLPAGLVHALGAGVMVAEVQTPSDTTFRMYDWEDRYDRPNRPMHAAAALRAVRPELTSEFLPAASEAGSRDLRVGEAYWIREHRCDGGAVALDPRPEVRVLMVAAGFVEIGGVPARRGTTVVVPAAIAPGMPTTADRGSVILEIGLV